MSAPTPKQREERDNCQLCKGHRGGVPGNENRVDGVVICDYCHATVSEFARLRTHSPSQEERVHGYVHKEWTGQGKKGSQRCFTITEEAERGDETPVTLILRTHSPEEPAGYVTPEDAKKMTPIDALWVKRVEGVRVWGTWNADPHKERTVAVYLVPKDAHVFIGQPLDGEEESTT